jgi:hypothetical protein
MGGRQLTAPPGQNKKLLDLTVDGEGADERDGVAKR